MYSRRKHIGFHYASNLKNRQAFTTNATLTSTLLTHLSKPRTGATPSTHDAPKHCNCTLCGPSDDAVRLPNSKPFCQQAPSHLRLPTTASPFWRCVYVFSHRRFEMPPPLPPSKFQQISAWPAWQAPRCFQRGVWKNCSSSCRSRVTYSNRDADRAGRSALLRFMPNLRRILMFDFAKVVGKTA